MTPLLSVSIGARYGKGKPVLQQADFEIAPGEALGLVGQSGSGKSTIALSVLNLLGLRGGQVTGSVLFQGRDLLQLSRPELRSVRGREIGFISQSPATALNPSMRLGAHLKEVWRAHSPGSGSFQELLESVRLPSDSEFLSRYPSQLSIGQGQRFLIALAIMHRPALLVADEPTSALDPITQAEIIALFSSLNRDRGAAILYISHDLMSLGNLCQRIAILHEGTIVETGETSQVFDSPRHPYTRALIAAIPARRPAP